MCMRMMRGGDSFRRESCEGRPNDVLQLKAVVEQAMCELSAFPAFSAFPRVE